MIAGACLIAIGLISFEYGVEYCRSDAWHWFVDVGLKIVTTGAGLVLLFGLVRVASLF